MHQHLFITDLFLVVKYQHFLWPHTFHCTNFGSLIIYQKVLNPAVSFFLHAAIVTAQSNHIFVEVGIKHFLYAVNLSHMFKSNFLVHFYLWSNHPEAFFKFVKSLYITWFDPQRSILSFLNFEVHLNNHRFVFWFHLLINWDLNTIISTLQFWVATFKIIFRATNIN